MDKQHVGILHPGDMGISVAASVLNSGHAVYWASEGRSRQTRERAEKHGIIDAGSLSHLCELCSAIVSVCPPDAAEAVADEVLSHRFTGLYVDANAISPQRAIRIANDISQAGATFVDGGIIGGPAWKPGTTWLYLSGTAADQAAALFASGPLETSIVSDEVGKASALKMCFAAYTKGSTALLCAALAAAEALGVREALAQQWSRDGSGFAEQAGQRAQQVTAKAWRFTGEMKEIAATFSDVGIPGEFHLAAAEIYRRLADFKGQEGTPDLDSVLAALLRRETKPSD